MNRYDRDASNFDSAVDAAVEFLLDRFSGRDRVLTIHYEVIAHDTGEVFLCGLQFRRVDNYTRVLGYQIGEEEFVVKGESSNWNTWTSVPVNGHHVEGGRIFRSPTGMFSFTKRSTPVGFVLTSGDAGIAAKIPGHLVLYKSHDSCWREAAVELPNRILNEGLASNSPDRRYFNRNNATFRVLVMSIQGNVRDSLGYTVEDGICTNTGDGMYGIYTGMMKLAPASNRQRTFNLDIEWNLRDSDGNDVTPRDQDYYTPLQGYTRFWFNEDGLVVKLGDDDIEPSKFDRDFFLTAFGLPETSHTYHISRVYAGYNTGVQIGDEVRNIRDFRSPSLEST